MTQKTLAIIKPDAVKKKVIGQIIERIEEEGGPVKKKIELAVVMEIEGCRMVIDIGENRVQDPFADGDASMEAVFQAVSQEKFSADRGDIGDAEKVHAGV